MNGLALELPDDLLDQIADRVADRLADHATEGDPGTADGWLRGAQQIATYLGCSESRVYSLVSARRIPIEHDGAAIVVKRSTLDEWVRSGGDRCPAGSRR